MIVLLATAAFAGTSALWGDAGEDWDPDGRIPDFTFAGYRGGEPVPEVPVVAEATGMACDGVTDDTAALQAAIDTTTGGALLLPAGTCVLSDVTRIDHGDLVLRGRGVGATTLRWNVSLADLYGPSEAWAYNGGMLRVEPPTAPEPLTVATGTAVRGSTTVEVADAGGITAGDLVVLVFTDPGDRSLHEFLHAGQHSGGDCEWQRDGYAVEWPVRIAAVDGTTLTLAQPLRIDVRPEWAVQVRSAPFLSEVGVESLTLAFPDVPYAGHLNEPGYNGIFVGGGVVDAWLRDLEVVNADSAILLDRLTKHLTVSGLTLSGREGHHGFNVAFSTDVLAEDVRFEQTLVHGFTLDHRTNGTVLHRVTGDRTVSLDHHRDAPFDNLFTAIDVPTDFFHGGSLCAGPPSGARSVSWGLQGPVAPPYFGWALGTVVAALDPPTPVLTDDREWFEPVDDLEPWDLYHAQRAWKAAGGPPTPEDTGSPAAGPPGEGASGPAGCGCGGGRAALWLAGLPLLALRHRESA